METTESATSCGIQRIRQRKRLPFSLVAVHRLEQLASREEEIRGENRRRAMLGWLIIGIVTCVLVPLFLERIWRAHEIAADAPAPARSHLMKTAVWVNSVLLLSTFPVAMLTAPRSRSRRVDQYIDEGCKSHGSNDNPFLRLILMLLMVGLLLGEFLVLDGILSMCLRFRLRKVDRHRAALILQRLITEPTGIDPRLLLRPGESPMHLRHVVAYLMAYEWADISPKGDWLCLLSPANRELRRWEKSLLSAVPGN